MALAAAPAPSRLRRSSSRLVRRRVSLVAAARPCRHRTAARWHSCARDDKNMSARSLWIRSLTRTARRLDGTDGVVSSRDVVARQPVADVLFGGVWKRMRRSTAVRRSRSHRARSGLEPRRELGGRTMCCCWRRPIARRCRESPASGGTLQPVTTLDTERRTRIAGRYLLPDGRHFLFTVRSDSPERLGIKLGSLESAEVRGRSSTSHHRVSTPSPAGCSS